MDILHDSSGNKIVSDVYLNPTALLHLNKTNRSRRLKNPITERPEKPLSARYKASVPVVQVENLII